MTTSFSLDMRRAMAAESTGAVPILLLTFTHPALEDPLLISTDMTTRLSLDPLIYGTVSRGDDYLWMPISAILPGDDEQAPPELRLTVDAIDREIFRVIRASSTPAKLKLELILAASPDVVEMSLDNLECVSAPYDEAQVTLVLSQEGFWAEPWPWARMTPTYFPGLHR